MDGRDWIGRVKVAGGEVGDGGAMAGHRKLTGDIHLGHAGHGFLNGAVREREGAMVVSPRVTSVAEREQGWRGARRGGRRVPAKSGEGQWGLKSDREQRDGLESLFTL